MKSILIEVERELVEVVRNPEYPAQSMYEYLWKIPIPILTAFSIEYFTINIGVESALSNSDDKIEGNKIIIAATESFPDPYSVITIVLHYHGIRDYSLLFPWITDSDLRERLGVFYEEAQKNFEQQAWLSFALMCGAIFEGMLYAKLDHPSNNNFFEMITKSYELTIINQGQKEIIDNVRTLRNLVHGNRYRTPYIQRANAMDIRSTLDTLIKTFCIVR